MIDYTKKTGAFITDSGYTVIFQNGRADRVSDNTITAPLSLRFASRSGALPPQIMEQARQALSKRSMHYSRKQVNVMIKKGLMIGMCACLLLACAACAEPGAEEPSSGGGTQAPASQESGTQPTQTQPESTVSAQSGAQPSAGPSAREPDSTTTQRPVQAVTLFSAEQAGAIDCVVYRANISVTPDKQAGKTYELKTREEMEPVLEAVQQKVWTPTGDTWALKTSPNWPDYTLLLKTGDDIQVELRLCKHSGTSGYIAVMKDGKLTRYEVPVATYQQLEKAHTFS